jgi:nicotinate-nucleotide pyrophosphorylase (carboxylating)
MQRPFDIQPFLIAALAEDVGSGDITTNATIPADAQAKFSMRARHDLILAGAVFLPDIFALIDPSVKIIVHIEDGKSIPKGGVIATLSGNARALLVGERMALNFIQQLSGIATLTRQYVNEVAHTHAKIIDTRKTIPTLRALQKYAVRCGGGANHRMGLYDAVLIKDNHIAVAGSITNAIAAARKRTNVKIEVECDTIAQVREAIAAKPDIILLDNMSNDQLRQAVALCKPAHITTEASGNVSLATVKAIADTGVDMISVGKLTHSAVAVDIGLDH